MVLITLPEMFLVHISRSNPKRLLLLIPCIGILTFIVLYFMASSTYPGGSQVDPNAKGFSWINNYWCNLLNATAINGQLNPARPLALAGMFVLCFSLSVFWYVFPQQVQFKPHTRVIIQLSGTLSMVIALFLFTAFHDAVVNLAGIFGLIALVGTFCGLYKRKLMVLLYFGVYNLLLVGLNNYVYYTKGLITYLPVIQKISFASFLIWICCICLVLYRMHK